MRVNSTLLATPNLMVSGKLRNLDFTSTKGILRMASLKGKDS